MVANGVSSIEVVGPVWQHRGINATSCGRLGKNSPYGDEVLCKMETGGTDPAPPALRGKGQSAPVRHPIADTGGTGPGIAHN